MIVALLFAAYPLTADRGTGATIATWPAPKCQSLLPGWSPDGTKVAFGGFGGEDFGLWVFSLANKRAVRVLAGGFTMPAWSGDGSALSFDDRAGGEPAVWAIETKDLPQPRGRRGKK